MNSYLLVDEGYELICSLWDLRNCERGSCILQRFNLRDNVLLILWSKRSSRSSLCGLYFCRCTHRGSTLGKWTCDAL